EEEDEEEEDEEDEEEEEKANDDGVENYDDDAEDNSAEAPVLDPFEGDAQVLKEPVDSISNPVHDIVGVDSKEAAPSKEQHELPSIKTFPNFRVRRCGFSPPNPYYPPSENKNFGADPQHQEQVNSCPASLPRLHYAFPSLGLRTEPSFQPPGPPPVVTPGSTYIMPKFSLDAMPLQTPYNSHAVYNDGPFTNDQSAAGTGANCTMASGGSKPEELLPFMDPFAPMVPRTSCDANVKSSIAKLGFDEWKAGVAGSERTSLKKRKAAEMESEPAEKGYPANPKTTETTSKMDETMDLSTQDADLPDAQPQSIAAILNSSESQLSVLSIPEPPKEDESPSKRVKTSHTGSFKTHAATAILGAVVGAVGTVAALASLPADYFA
ncbi:hypothetical protein BDW59DRAFT_168199, partial [Aspergillus cavernicola]